MKKIFIILSLLILSCSKDDIYVQIGEDNIENKTTLVEFTVSDINKTTSHYNPYFVPFFNYYQKIGTIAEMASCKNVGGRTWLNLNNNSQPDQIISLGKDCGDSPTEIYVIIDGWVVNTFQTPHYGGTSKISKADFNNDGVDDIVLFHAGKDNDNGLAEGTSLYIVLFDSYGNGEIKKLSDRKEYYHSGTVGDVDGDGDIDILPVGPQNNDGILFKNDGYGNFEEIKVFESESFVNAFASELYDINSDGNLDFILGGHEWKEFDHWEWKNRIYLGNGDGTFKPDPIRLPTMEGWQVILDFDFYDLNHDGIEEIIITRTGGISNSYDFKDGFYQSFKIEVLSKEGSTYKRTAVLNAPNGYQDTWVEYVRWTGITDVDGDGNLDIVPDKESLNDVNYDYLSQFRGLYYKGDGFNNFEEKYKR